MILRNTILSLGAVLLLTACSSKHENMPTSSEEVKKHDNYIAHAKKIKKNRKNKIKKSTIDLKKFCFKDNRSIHYKSEERCK